MTKEKIQKELEEDYSEVEGLRRGEMSDWMFERVRCESEGVNFSDDMTCGMAPPKGMGH